MAAGGRQSFDDPVEDRAEQRRLVLEAVIEGALRHASALRDGLDARRAVAALEKQIRGGVEDALAELRRFLRRGATAAGDGAGAGALRLGRGAALRLTAGGTSGASARRAG